MLIRHMLPRVRPPGNVVYQVRCSASLATDAVAVILSGPPYGFARELITGAPFLVSVATPDTSATPDGMGSYLTGGATLVTAEAHPSWLVLGTLSIGWRGYLGNTINAGTVLQNMPSGGNGGSATPYQFTADDQMILARANASNYRVWQAPSYFSAGVSLNAQMTRIVTAGADMSVSPSFYINDVALGVATSISGGGGSGLATGTARPLVMGRRGDGQNLSDLQTTNIMVVASRQWTADEARAFHLSPYAVLEEAPRWYFSNNTIASVSWFPQTISME